MAMTGWGARRGFALLLHLLRRSASILVAVTLTFFGLLLDLSLVCWLGLVGLLYVEVYLGWLAGAGVVDVVSDVVMEPVTGVVVVVLLLAGGWEVLVDALRDIILPASLLGYFSLAYI